MANKTQKETITDLEEEIDRLRDKIDDLQDEVEELENTEREDDYFDLTDLRNKTTESCIIVRVESMEAHDKIMDFIKTYIYPHYSDQEKHIF